MVRRATASGKGMAPKRPITYAAGMISPTQNWLATHPATGDHVVFAPSRANRPRSANNGCKLCMLDGKTVLASTQTSLAFAAIPNDYPVFHANLPVPLYGRQEVLLEGGNEHLAPTAWNEQQTADMLTFAGSRVQAAWDDPAIQTVLFFKNEGEEAGASQTHPHSQLYGFGIQPPRRSEAPAFAQELPPAGLRFFERGDVVAAAHPYARFEGEALIIIQRAVHLGALTDVHRTDVAAALKPCFQRAKKEGFAFNLIHIAEKSAPGPCVLTFLPRPVSHLAGLELGTGLFVNTLAPERAAEAYRAAE